MDAMAPETAVPVTKVELVHPKSHSLLAGTNTLLGPYNEDDRLEVVCRAPNGMYPPPAER